MLKAAGPRWPIPLGNGSTHITLYSTPGIAEGVTTEEMQLQETFAGWDFDAMWVMDVFPVFRWQDLSEVADGSAHDPYLIRDVSDFDEFADSNHAVKYWSSGVHTRLMADIDLSGRTYSDSVIDHYAGVFDGDGFAIRNLTIDAGGVAVDFLGLFGVIDDVGSAIRHLGVENIMIINAGLVDYAGGLAGSIVSGHVDRCYSTGSVQGYHHIWRVGRLYRQRKWCQSMLFFLRCHRSLTGRWVVRC